jgi:hypothetical protein
VRIEVEVKGKMEKDVERERIDERGENKRRDKTK